MADTLRESIITSECAERFLQRITPIYDDSYVMLWVQEAIGREYDDLWYLVNTLPDQLFPEKATWAIELWEKRYGITPNPELSIEERRSKVREMREIPTPFTPARLEKALANITGRALKIIDNIAPYTFGVYLSCQDTQNTTSASGIKQYIDTHKPSHLSYDIIYQTEEKINVKVSTSWWRLSYPMTGSGYRAGEVPQTATLGATDNPGIKAVAESKGYVYPYALCGTAGYAQSGL